MAVPSQPLRVSILLPCYNERDFISRALDSVLEFEYPAGTDAEILVIDGMSSDGTREIVHRYQREHSSVRQIDNPKRTQAHALNIGIRQAFGDLLIRLDAHSEYPRDYASQCISTSLRTGAANVGGLVDTVRRGTGYQSAVIQALTTHKFGVGNSGFRTGVVEGPADTVPYGCFQRSIFSRVGYFDERLQRAQDYEMNRRITSVGGKIWLNPAIRLRYFQQAHILSFLRKQILREAPYNAYLWYLAPYAFSFRHAVTAVFAAGVLGGVVLSMHFAVVARLFAAVMIVYAVMAVIAAAQQAKRYRNSLHIVVLPLCFFLYHFLHGLGVLGGLFLLLVGRAPVQGQQEPWTGAGRFRGRPIGLDRPLC